MQVAMLQLMLGRASRMNAVEAMSTGTLAGCIRKYPRSVRSEAIPQRLPAWHLQFGSFCLCDRSRRTTLRGLTAVEDERVVASGMTASLEDGKIAGWNGRFGGGQTCRDWQQRSL